MRDPLVSGGHGPDGRRFAPGVFEANPVAHGVNGSLWTLPYEVACYACLAVVGVAGLLTKRRILLAVTLVLILLGWWAKDKHWYLVEPFNIELPYILRFFAYFPPASPSSCSGST